MSVTVFAVIPTHNRRELTQACLLSLRRQTMKNFNIIVVDDGSSDGTSKMIATEFPEVVLLNGNGNLWWTGAINKGIQYALDIALPSDYILVINDDLEVDEHYVENLVHFAQSKPNALVGSVTVDIHGPDRIDSGGVRINWWTAKRQVLNRGRRLSQFKPGYHVETSYLTGRGTLLPTRLFHEIGLYDEKHLPHSGDSELPVRAKKRGYELFVCYSAVVKSHLDASATINIAKTYSLRDIKQYFFDIKSRMRLKNRYYFAKTAARGNPIQFLSYFAFDLLRISCNYFSKLRL